MRSELFGQHLEAPAGERFALQNAKMLRVALDGEVLARQGSMVAYQGQIDFHYEGSGGIGRFIKKALTGEGLPLMRCRGRGDLFLAHDADEVHLLYLEDEGLSVNGGNVLAFDATLSWDVHRVRGASMLAGGAFNTVLYGTGFVAITAHGTPVVLRTDEAPTYADMAAAVAWSAHLETSVHRSFKLGALIGRGSGEAVQIAFHGQGFVVVQASEGPVVPPHRHGTSGQGGGVDFDTD